MSFYSLAIDWLAARLEDGLVARGMEIVSEALLTEAIRSARITESVEGPLSSRGFAAEIMASLRLMREDR